MKLNQTAKDDTGQRIVDADAGELTVRLAETREEIDAALALRYKIFYDEMAAKPTPEMAARRQDFDDFDPIADHLIAIDRAIGDGPEAVVATYRLIRREAAAEHGQFYSEDEYDITPLLNWPGPILELGRSCVGEGHRTRSTMTLMWRGLAEYVIHHDIGVMFGCASLHGTNPQELALPLAYLHHHHMAPPELRPRALPERFVDMNLMDADAIDRKKALVALPPLIKGYLRLGGFIGEGAVVDVQFNTTDVCIIVKTDLVTGKYFRHYTRDHESKEDGAK
ncbi:MAG TPA: GNAT family N-acyltransferase [Alphaproteobacteria bacterium]|nr:GNAT family N-acyltransferase [Alphaproteobacteria bacterium]